METTTKTNVMDYNNVTFTENGALSNATTGSALIDQFGKAGNYRGRNISDVFNDQETIWEENEELAARFPFYLRMITRKIKVNDNAITEKVQKGQGARDESFKRLLWIARNHPTTFYNNIWILPLVGSWKDIWTLMFYDELYKTNAIDNMAMFELLNEGLKCDAQVDLVKKFMPRIKSMSKCKTDWTKCANKLAKQFADFNGLDYIKGYNKLKATGTAHDFQKIICGRDYSKLNWNRIPGRALNLLVNGKFLENQSLVDDYTEWVLKQPTAKFTGYVYELGKIVNENCPYSYQRNIEVSSKLPLYKRVTIDRQFDELIKKAKEDNGGIQGNVWCALDTSGSMTTRVQGTNVTALDICTSLGVFFAELNTGAFHNNVIMFDNTSHVRKLTGSFTDRMCQLPMDAMGGTNFQSIVDEIIRIRRNHPNVPLSDYPQTILVVSDMQFNPSGGYSYHFYEKPSDKVVRTNYEEMKSKLATVFPQDFVDQMKFIWWDCTSRKSDFPATLENPDCYFFSGFDGSIITLLLGGDAKEVSEDGTVRTISMQELVQKALSQEMLSYIKI